MSEDPIGFAGGDVNLYRYVTNNPVMYIDPYGKVRWGQFFAGVGLAVLGGGLVAITVANPGYAVLTKFTGVTVGVGVGTIGLALILGSFTATASTQPPQFQPINSCLLH